MGHCWSDNIQTEERFEVVKSYRSDGDPMFHSKAMNKEVEPVIERNK